MNIRNKFNKGYSLIEILIVVTIIFVTITLGFYVYNSQNRVVFVKKQVQYVKQYEKCAQNYSRNTMNFVATTDFYKTGCFPPELYANYNPNNGVWTQSWGNVTFGIESVNSTPNPGDLLFVNYPNVPYDSCSIFVNSMINYAYDITINGTLAGLQKSGSGANDIVYPIGNISEIAPLCARNSTAIIKIRFYKELSAYSPNGKYTSYTGYGYEPGLANFDAQGQATATLIANSNSNAQAKKIAAQKALP